MASEHNNNGKNIIGIVGGIGPEAGVYLHNKIVKLTKAKKDQEHFSIIHMAYPHEIVDRSSYLLDPQNYTNPGIAVYNIIERLYRSGAQVIGVPCNTCHARPILDLVETKVRENLHSKITLLNMIYEVYKEAVKKYKKVGLLATLGTYSSQLYQEIFPSQIEILHPISQQRCQRVHQAIYDPKLGIKANAGLLKNDFAQTIFIEEIDSMVENGAEAIIMGCTEIPIVLQQSDVSVPLFDPTAILAQSLIDWAKKK